VNNKSLKSGVQAWFVYRQLDWFILYSHIYSAIDSIVSKEKAIAFREMSSKLLSHLKEQYPWIEAKQIHTIELDTHEIAILYGKYILLVLIKRRGKSMKKIHQIHEKMLSIIETDAQGRLASRVDDPAILRDVWVKCEEILRPYIIHLF